MAVNSDTAILLTTIFTCLQVLGGHGDANIKIQPEICSEMKPEDVQISCSAEGLDKAQEILLMQISRKGDKPLAQIHGSIKNFKNQTSSNSKYIFTGYIDKNVALSNLNLTLLKPGKEWAGTYTCKLYFVDQFGMMKYDTADGELTFNSIDRKVLGDLIKPLMEKISLVEKKTTLLQNETTSLKKETEFLQSERANLIKETITLQNKISKLEEKSKSLENTVLSMAASDSSVVKKLAALGHDNDDLLEKIQTLVRKDDILDDKLEKQYTQLERQIDGLSGNKSVSSLETRLILLKKTIEKGQSDRDANKASMSSLTRRVGALEQQERGHKTLIKSLVTKYSAVERNLGKTDQKLKQEMTERLKHKSSLASVIKKVALLQKTSGDYSKLLQSLKSKDSQTEKNLQETNKKLSQEVTNRLSDKAAVTSYVKKVRDLERESGDQAKRIKSLTDKSVRVDRRLSSIDKVDAKQSVDIENILNRFKKSVIPGLSTLKSLQGSRLEFTKQIEDLEEKDSALAERILELESKHPKQPKSICFVDKGYKKCYKPGKGWTSQKSSGGYYPNYNPYHSHGR